MKVLARHKVAVGALVTAGLLVAVAVGATSANAASTQHDGTVSVTESGGNVTQPGAAPARGMTVVKAGTSGTVVVNGPAGGHGDVVVVNGTTTNGGVTVTSGDVNEIGAVPALGAIVVKPGASGVVVVAGAANRTSRR